MQKKNSYDYTNISNQDYSILDLIEKQAGASQVFKSKNGNNFYQIKMTDLNEGDSSTTMIQFININNTLQYNQIQKHNELLNLINATVSHELRNPLNSICSQAM